MTTRQKKTVRTVKKSADTGRLRRSDVRAAVITVHGNSRVSVHSSNTSRASGSNTGSGGCANENPTGAPPTDPATKP